MEKLNKFLGDLKLSFCLKLTLFNSLNKKKTGLYGSYNENLLSVSWLDGTDKNIKLYNS